MSSHVMNQLHVGLVNGSSHHLRWHQPPDMSLLSTRDRQQMSTTVNHTVVIALNTARLEECI
jgi:hypothetical protein